MLCAPAHYVAPSDLCVITCHFNWLHYHAKRHNFDIFARSLRRSGIALRAIECARSRSEFELPASPDVIHVACRSFMWQKERLLGIALQHVPACYSKIAWIDADVLFASADWAQRTSAALERYAVVQLFDTAIRLPPDSLQYTGQGDRYLSFASISSTMPNILLKGVYHAHGHTGFGWAARREVLDAFGFYDHCVSGSGDHVMAHAFSGDWDSPCITRTFGEETAMHGHFRHWAEPMYEAVRARVGCVTGCALHLWHGDVANRQYSARNDEMVALRFNPSTDIVVNDDRCWEWAPHRGDLQAWGRRYFVNRREDDCAIAASPGAQLIGF